MASPATRREFVDGRSSQKNLGGASREEEGGLARRIGVGFSTLVSQVDAEAGTSQVIYEWTPERVAQAIVALGSGASFLNITEFDDTDASYYFYGGLDGGSSWQINRYDKTTFVKTSARESGNPSYMSLAAAWTDRLTLTYS